MARAKTPKSGSKKSVKSVPHVDSVKPNGNGADLESEIRVRAYELYVERGYAEGYQHEDWLVAEREVKAKRAAAGA
jgi:hypothetical protein